MGFNQDNLYRTLLTWLKKPTYNEDYDVPFTGKDLKMLRDALMLISNKLDALEAAGGGSGIQSVTGTNVDITDPLNPIVNLTSSNIFDSSYGDVATAITNIDFDQGQLTSDLILQIDLE